MKRFYYKITTTGSSKYGGRYQYATIYQIKKNKLEYLGETRKWNTGSYRGNDSEVNQWLISNKIIPKKWSNNEGIFTPYYLYNDKYSINEI